MTQNLPPTCSDVIITFKRASALAGVQPAMAVIKSFGVLYAAAVPINQYAAAIEKLEALIQTHSAPKAAPFLNPAEVRAKWNRNANEDGES